LCVVQADTYLQWHSSASTSLRKGRPLFHGATRCVWKIQNLTSCEGFMAFKLIAYGCSSFAFQDYFQVSETTARLCLLKFCWIVSTDESVTSVFARRMTRANARQVSALQEAQHSAARMIGSLDCMHVGWKNCPVAW
jgi:acyl-CoA hydrolase